MKRLILCVYNKLRRLRNEHRWNKECKLQLRKIKSKCSAFQLQKESSFVIILPHADDEWIGCGSLISSSDYKVSLCNADMEGGDSESIHLIRRAEIERLANMYSKPIHTLCNNKVNYLKEYYFSQFSKWLYVQLGCFVMMTLFMNAVEVKGLSILNLLIYIVVYMIMMVASAFLFIKKDIQYFANLIKR